MVCSGSGASAFPLRHAASSCSRVYSRTSSARSITPSTREADTECPTGAAAELLHPPHAHAELLTRGQHLVREGLGEEWALAGEVRQRSDGADVGRQERKDGGPAPHDRVVGEAVGPSVRERPERHCGTRRAARFGRLRVGQQSAQHLLPHGAH